MNDKHQQSRETRRRGWRALPVLAGLALLGAGLPGPAAASTDVGKVRSWGENRFGQLGNGADVALAPDPDPDIAGGGYHSVALNKITGKVYVWGSNRQGQWGIGQTCTVDALGVGHNCSGTTPMEVNNLSNVKDVDAGFYFTVALDGVGDVYVWGDNSFGQFGNGDDCVANPSQCGSTTRKKVTISGVAEIAAGSYHVLARKTNGEVWAWGYDRFGQLGDNTTTGCTIGGTARDYCNLPVKVSLPAGVTGRVKSLAAGGFHSLLVDGQTSTAGDSDNTALAWGYNTDGTLGDNDTAHKFTPVTVLSPTGSGALTGVSVMDGGNAHTLAVNAVNKTVWAWGANDTGQVGDGTKLKRLLPVALATPTDVTDVGAGGNHSLALTDSDGGAWGWGDNGFLQADNTPNGDPTVDPDALYRLRPGTVKNSAGLPLQGMAKVEGGYVHSLAVEKPAT